VVNLTAGLMAFAALTIVAQPADTHHPYGHDKAEYFSSGFEGALILVAAVTIIYTGVQRLLHPGPLGELGIGLVVSLVASAVNFVVSRLMLRVARQYDSITLEADAQHLMTDVWTSVGVVGGLAVVMLAPSLGVLDPIIAILVALNIVVTGIRLMRRSIGGLMDGALPAEELGQIDAAVKAAVGLGVEYHGLLTRKSGSRRFAELHLILPGQTTVSAAHDEQFHRHCAQSGMGACADKAGQHWGINE
jgi:cation diffusion facilitator family transporter